MNKLAQRTVNSVLALSLALASTSTARAQTMTAEQMAEMIHTVAPEKLLSEAQKNFAALSVEGKRQLIKSIDAFLEKKMTEIESLSVSPRDEAYQFYGKLAGMVTAVSFMGAVLRPWVEAQHMGVVVRMTKDGIAAFAAVSSQSAQMDRYLDKLAERERILAYLKERTARNTRFLGWAIFAGAVITPAMVAAIYPDTPSSESAQLQIAVLKGQVEPLKLIVTGFRAQLRALLVTWLKETEEKK